MVESVSVRLDDDLEADLDTYREQFPFEPSKSEVIRQALREFLDRELDAES